MTQSISRPFPAILSLLLALPLAACVSTTHLYRGEMDLVSVSGDACPDKGIADSHVPLELVLEQNSFFGGHSINGYFNGPEIQTGHFFGNDFARLLVVYPDEAGAVVQGHTLALFPTPEGVNGELHERPPLISSGCYFEKAALTLKNDATNGEARTAFDRHRKLFGAEAHENRGHALLKAGNPEEALRDLTESLKLRNEADPDDRSMAYPALPVAIAHVMAGREGEALSYMRGLFAEKPNTGVDILKQRMDVSGVLCAYSNDISGDARQKASEKLMDAVAREFSGLNGVGTGLAECYRELGQERIEQEEPAQSIEYFRKALSLKPDDADSIAGIVIANIAEDTPAEGRRFLQEHSRIVIEKAGRDNYNGSLSYLYAAEAKQAERARDFARAEQLLREAIKILPGERAYIINLATVLGKDAKPGEARKLLEDARKRCGDETCRLEYSDELTRQEQIERMIKRLER